MASGRFCNPPPPFIPMDIRFWLRRAKKPDHAGTVYCTCSTAEVEATPFTTGIQAWPPQPNAKKPNNRTWQLKPVMRLFGNTPDVLADNATLDTLYAHLHSIRNELLKKGLPCGPHEVIDAMREYGKQAPTLMQAADVFLTERAKQIRPASAPSWDKTGYSPNTIKKYRARLGLLTEYLKSIQAMHMPLARFTARHGDGLAQMIMTRVAKPGKYAGRERGKCGPDYAGKVVGLVSQVLDFAINKEWLSINPLCAWKAPAGFDKPLLYLWPEQVAQLEQHKFRSEYLQRVADSFLFSCWTGLAWADLDAFEVEQHITPTGWLKMQRLKTGIAFSFPMLPGATRLLKKYEHVEGGLPRYENGPLNRGLKEIAGMLGFELDLTHHAARRTFGMFLLNEDVPLATVAAVLGHRNEKTTAKYYARFIESRKIARDFEALNRRLSA